MNKSQSLPAASDSASASVERASNGLLQAVNASNCDRITGLWCEDGVLMPPHHPSVRGRAAIGEYFEQLFRQGRFEFVFGSSEVEVAGKIAVQRVEYTASFWPADGGAQSHDAGKGVHVFQRRTDGEWCLAMDIWNSDSAVAAAGSRAGDN